MKNKTSKNNAKKMASYLMLPVSTKLLLLKFKNKFKEKDK